MTTILGIDPGSRITGYGVITCVRQNYTYLAAGCIRVSATDLSEKLQQVFTGISEVMATYKPDEVAVEQVFVHRNVAGALKLGQARGAAIVAVSLHSVPVAEYAARQIKQSVVGYGAAKKEQMQEMVVGLLQLSSTPTADAADALAVALCHAQTRRSLARLNNATVVCSGRVRSRRRIGA